MMLSFPIQEHPFPYIYSSLRLCPSGVFQSYPLNRFCIFLSKHPYKHYFLLLIFLGFPFHYTSQPAVVCICKSYRSQYTQYTFYLPNMKCIHTLDDMQLRTKIAWLCGDKVGGRRTYSLARGKNCSCLGRSRGREFTYASIH